MSPDFSLLWLWGLMVVVMTLGWLWQWRHENAGIVDVLWAGGLGGGAILIAVLGDGALAPRVALAVLGGAWELRLATHLASRFRREPEDGRYHELRLHWNGSPIKFWLMFEFQAVLVVLFALPFLAVARNPVNSVGWITTAIVIWLLSVLGETIADRQLARFKAVPENKGKTMRAGLWRYSRHPNYFFEWLHWFAWVALAVGSPLWWLAWVGPVGMYVFLRYVSGVPWVEERALRSRGEDYRDYQRKTATFFPWFPSKRTEK